MAKKITATWTKENNEWCLQVRCGGHGAEYVGKLVVVHTRKDNSYRPATLGELVADYGAGDVAVFRAG